MLHHVPLLLLLLLAINLHLELLLKKNRHVFLPFDLSSLSLLIEHPYILFYCVLSQKYNNMPRGS